MDMPGMSGGDMGGMSSMGMMPMAFMSGTGSPLYSASWMPMTTGAYAGTCIFLIVLAMLFRTGFAFKNRLERHWSSAEETRRYVIRGKPEPDSDGDSTRARLVSQDGSATEDVKIVKSALHSKPPLWRLSTDFPRAFLVTVLAGVGYLLLVRLLLPVVSCVN
jgi:solute carrier family 31 (copper transporter), member 1